MARLAGKVAIVTGAGSGIGEATARAFAREGAGVVLVGRREAPLAAGADVILGSGGEALVVVGDVSISNDVDTIIARTVDHFGRLDCVFNNAGIQGAADRIVDTSVRHSRQQHQSWRDRHPYAAGTWRRDHSTARREGGIEKDWHDGRHCRCRGVALHR